MALDAQAAPPLRLPVEPGPLGKWLADRAQAKLEAERRFNELLPEPILVGLQVLRVVFPETVTERLTGAPEFTSALLALRSSESQSPAVIELERALALYQREIDDGKWPEEYRWPPQDEYFRRYNESFDLGPRPAQPNSRMSHEDRLAR